MALEFDYGIQEVKGNNAQCPMCFEEIIKIKTYDDAEKECRIAKGQKAFKMTINSSSSRGKSVYLCLHHAKIFIGHGQNMMVT